MGQELSQKNLRLKSGDKVSQAFRHVQRPSAIETSTTTERVELALMLNSIRFIVYEMVQLAQAQLLQTWKVAV